MSSRHEPAICLADILENIDRISLAVIWNAITEELPALRADVAAALERLTSS